MLKLAMSMLAVVLAVPALAAPPKAPPKTNPNIEPEAVAALKNMGAFLREQPTFEVSSQSLVDSPLGNGQVVQLEQQVKMSVQRPNKLRAHVTSDRKDREFIYDGTNLTMYGKRWGYYGSVPAPPRIIELADVLTDRYDIDLPLVDLFYWGTDRDSVSALTSAIDVGPATLDGKECEQYAFRQPGLDWQVWIQSGAEPLPLKLVLTATDDKTRPQNTMRLDWALGPRFPDEHFTFRPPPDAHRIEVRDLMPAKNVD